jgi:ABC-type multidrug transport system fused ATPase/permease subunit
LTHTNGKLVNAISSDVSRIDYCAQWFHAIWTAPIQLSVCLVLLCLQLGPAAIVGFALFLLVGPLQTFIIKLSFNVRQTSVKWTDKRAQLLRELLGSMRIIKVFVYEVPFLRRLKDIRQKEMQGIRSLLFIRSFNQAVAFSVPTLAAVLSFVVYARTHNDLDPVSQQATLLIRRSYSPRSPCLASCASH